jgi:uncharacterized tellurite resistance protein B-like protein
MFQDLMRFLQSDRFHASRFLGPRRKALSMPPHVADPRLSVAVLMVEAALQDEHFCERERGTIQTLLMRRFALTAGEYAQLIECAEQQNKQMVQLLGHTSDISETMAMNERVEVIGMLWEVAYADDQLHPEEELLIRRIAGLISVGDRDRVFARQQAIARHAPPQHPAE